MLANFLAKVQCNDETGERESLFNFFVICKIAWEFIIHKSTAYVMSLSGVFVYMSGTHHHHHPVDQETDGEMGSTGFGCKSV